MEKPSKATPSEQVVCQHKPGDVWADGCCTSRLNKQAEASVDDQAPVDDKRTAWSHNPPAVEVKSRQ